MFDDTKGIIQFVGHVIQWPNEKEKKKPPLRPMIEELEPH